MSAHASERLAPSPRTTPGPCGAKRGRPRLTSEEQERRAQWKEEKKTIFHLTTAVAKNLMPPSEKKTKTRNVSANTNNEKTPAGDSPEANSPTDSPPLAAALSAAQRALGINFGEDGPVPPDVPPLRKPGQALPENVKRFILIRNGCAMPPRDIILEVKERFGLVISSPQVARYDPTTAAGQTLCDEYKRLFARSRREAQLIANCLGVGNQGFRITVLHNLCVKAVENDQPWEALRILDQVAKEKCAGVHNKRRPLTKKQLALREKLRLCRPEDLPPLPAREVVVEEMTVSEAIPARRVMDWEEGWMRHWEEKFGETRNEGE